MPPASKTTGGYVNASLAKTEAANSGYDDCVLLNREGLVAECTAENIFVVRDKVIHTPPHSSGALAGITQDTIRVLAADLDLEVRETQLSRSDLYIADEMFVCGTASEVTSVKSIDDRDLAFPGEVGHALADSYSKVVRGQMPQYREWVEHAS